MDYQQFYDMTREEIQRLMEMDMYKDDYRLIKTLAALYELTGLPCQPDRGAWDR